MLNGNPTLSARTCCQHQVVSPSRIASQRCHANVRTLCVRQAIKLASIKSILLLFVIGMSFCQCHADQITLRNWEFIDNVQITSFDENGLVLADGKFVPLYQVESAVLSSGNQSELNELISKVGLPMFRVHTRLRRGDINSLSTIYGELEETLIPDQGFTRLLYSLGRLKLELQSGNRSVALKNLLAAASVLQDETNSQEKLDLLKSTRFDWITNDATTFAQFAPIWSESDQQDDFDWNWLAEKTNQLNSKSFPGVIVLASSFASWNSQDEMATTWRNQLDSSIPSQRELQEILQLQTLVARQQRIDRTEWKVKVEKLQPDNQAVALYWLGRAGMREENLSVRRESILFLLRIPAEHADQSELASAGLFLVFESLAGLNQEAGRLNVARELLQLYPHSPFASELRKKTESEVAPK